MNFSWGARPSTLISGPLQYFFYAVPLSVFPAKGRVGAKVHQIKLTERLEPSPQLMSLVREEAERTADGTRTGIIIRRPCSRRRGPLGPGLAMAANGCARSGCNQPGVRVVRRRRKFVPNGPDNALSVGGGCETVLATALTTYY